MIHISSHNIAATLAHIMSNLRFVLLCSIATMASTGRPAKLARLNVMRRLLPHMSASAMSALIQDIDSHGLPELHGRSHFAEARTKELEQHCAYGPLIISVPVQCKDGSAADLLVVNPLSLLSAAYSNGGSFHEFFNKKHSQCPSSTDKPWHLVLYADEVVPGNPLAHDNTRKMWVFYGSFLQFGSVELSREELWLTLCAKRTSGAAVIQGGVSQMVKAMLQVTFCSEACDVRRAGLLLKGPDGQLVRLFFDFGLFIADGAAHKSVWGCKGDAGTKFCMFCKNLVSESSSLVDDDGDEILVCSKTNRALIDFASDSDVLGTIDRLILKRSTLSPADLKLWEQACGFSHCPGGLLFDPSVRHLLKPISQFMHDWMHGIFVKGVFQTTAFLLIKEVYKAKICMYNGMQSFLEGWLLPKNKIANLALLVSLFNPKRKEANKTANTFKCTASEGLAVYPLLALYVQEKLLPKNVCTLACNAFLFLANVIDLLVAVPLGIIAPTDLQQSIDAFLSACHAAAWTARMHAKFHWMMHYSDHLQLWGTLLTCWCHERKHKLVKRYSADVYNLRTFEATVLSEMVCHDLELLKHHGLSSEGVKLVEPHQASKKMLQFLADNIEDDISSCLTSLTVSLVPAGTCSRGDVVLCKDKTAAEVWFHCEVNGRCLSLLLFCDLVSYNDDTYQAVWRKQRSPTLVSSELIVCPMCHRNVSQEVVASLIPLQHRF